jgi:hypothetical protein
MVMMHVAWLTRSSFSPSSRRGATAASPRPRGTPCPRFSEEQMIYLVTLIGLYLLTCTTVNSLGVPAYPSDRSAPWEPVDNGSPS